MGKRRWRERPIKIAPTTMTLTDGPPEGDDDREAFKLYYTEYFFIFFPVFCFSRTPRFPRTVFCHPRLIPILSGSHTRTDCFTAGLLLIVIVIHVCWPWFCIILYLFDSRGLSTHTHTHTQGICHGGQERDCLQ